MSRSKAFIVLNREGVGSLLKFTDTENLCKSFADKAVDKLGEGYEASTYVGKTRVNASVKATTRKTKRLAKEQCTILKAVLRK